MPLLKLVPPTQTKKPGNKFFATIIVIGILVLVGIWFSEKSAHPVKKIQTKLLAEPSAKKSISSSTQVLVMTKTNLSPNKLTNVVSVLLVKTQSVTPVVRTNISASSGFAPRPVQNVFEAQLALARQGISAGSIDGAIGSQTRAALQAFQAREGLPTTGELDFSTKIKLLLTAPPYGEFLVTTNDLARLQPLGTNWWSKSQQTQLAYETILELVSEKSCCSPNFLKLLNPSTSWTNGLAGTILRVPALEKPKPKTAAFVRVNLSAKNLKVFDTETNLIAHFPCSIAQKVEKRPVGELVVEKVATDPDYTFNPENFPESVEARSLKTKLILPPGPNNPVGTVWIGLSKPGYGIHGTPKPEDVGRTESHGCFRLANWNAEYLVRLIRIGTPVFVEP